MAERVELPLLFSYDETARFKTLRFRAPEDYLASYRIPGQYCQLASSVDAKPIFIAFAAAPGNHSQVEFLLRRGGESVERFLAEVEVTKRAWASPVEGKGFPAADSADPLLVIGAGSGIAPLRALIDHHLATDLTPRAITLLYGERTNDDFAYVGQFSSWAARGVKIHLCSSQQPPDRKDDGLHIRHHQGHLQLALQPLLAEKDIGRSVAYLCGMPKMIAEVKQELAVARISKIFLNY